jgi:hypothetical protein
MYIPLCFFSTVICLTLFLQNAFCSEEQDAIYSFKIDYKKDCSELCLIGEKYDTDKSSQRKFGHSHPYTLFYHSIFRNQRNEELAIAELGILNGASLLMWQEYFPKAKLYGFDNSLAFLESFKEKYNNDRITLGVMDVWYASDIVNALESTGIKYDLIIEDTTHQIEDQIRVIYNAHAFLKPGGMFIIEDIFKHYNEVDYLERLSPILDLFQDYYFVTLDHENRRSPGWDNDKLLVLIKAGAKPIFNHTKRITIITPSMRPYNLYTLRDSINFDYVDEWIIVYDETKVLENPHLFASEGNSKIKEYIHKGPGISGNPQRNYALDHVQNENTYLYFLDDDNSIHKDLYRLLDIIDDGKIYTFDQGSRLLGHLIAPNNIDTAMFLVDFKLCKNMRWDPHVYGADVLFILECYTKNPNKWIYVNNTLCTYNHL